ncbi:hypothetical protein WMF39_35725 [Sorangium sp. So ce1504]|uniref:hypothetical protein n=1 Tax=Sorangium sp. So ce1504 TaxID=3133337 RepID=UPI003F609F0E
MHAQNGFDVWTDGAYLLKLSPGGDVLWNHKITPPPDEYDHPLYNADLAIDSAGNALTVTAPESAAGNLAVSKRDPTGAVLWTLSFGASAHGITISPSGVIALTGAASAAVDFGTGPIPHADGSDIFVATFNP